MRRSLARLGPGAAAALLLAVGGSAARADELRLAWLTDGIMAPAAIALALSGEYIAASAPAPSLGTPDRADINALDRLAVLPYSRSVDIASTALEISSVAAPLALILALDRPEWFDAVVVTAEALLLADGVKAWIKDLVPRYRPYVYSPAGAPGVDASEDPQSFPSGHATVAFAGATMVSLLVSIYWPDSPWRVPVIAASYGIATATAAFRVLAGMHFITDVAAGALAGTACAIGVTLLHRDPGSGEESKASADRGGLSAAVIPGTILVRYRFPSRSSVGHLQSAATPEAVSP